MDANVSDGHLDMGEIRSHYHTNQEMTFSQCKGCCGCKELSMFYLQRVVVARIRFFYVKTNFFHIQVAGRRFAPQNYLAIVMSLSLVASQVDGRMHDGRDRSGRSICVSSVVFVIFGVKWKGKYFRSVLGRSIVGMSLPVTSHKQLVGLVVGDSLLSCDTYQKLDVAVQ